MDQERSQPRPGDTSSQLVDSLIHPKLRDINSSCVFPKSFSWAHTLGFAGLFCGKIIQRNCSRGPLTEIFDKKNPEAVDKYFSKDFQQHQPGLDPGRENFKKYLTSLFYAFPDYKGKIEQIIGDGDMVAIHFTWSGTHKNPFRRVPATNKKLNRRAADMLRVKNGKITDHWEYQTKLTGSKDLEFCATKIKTPRKQ